MFAKKGADTSTGMNICELLWLITFEAQKVVSFILVTYNILFLDSEPDIDDVGTDSHHIPLLPPLCPESRMKTSRNTLDFSY